MSPASDGWTEKDADILSRIAWALERVADALDRVFPPPLSKRGGK